MYSFVFSLLNFYPRAITPVAVCLYGLGLRFDGIKRIFPYFFIFLSYNFLNSKQTATGVIARGG